MTNRLNAALAMAFCSFLLISCSGEDLGLNNGSSNLAQTFNLMDANGNPLPPGVFWSASIPGNGGPTNLLGFSSTLAHTDFADGDTCNDPTEGTKNVADGTAFNDGCTGQDDSTATFECPEGGEVEVSVDDGTNQSSVIVDCDDDNDDDNDGTPDIPFNDIESETLSGIVFYMAPVHDGNLGGRLGADTWCSDHKPSNVGGDSVHAVISLLGSSSSLFLSVGDDIISMPLNYGIDSSQEIISNTGVHIADDWADLLDETIDSSLADAGLTTTTDKWWSGSHGDGTGNYNTCGNWTDNNEGFLTTKGAHGAYGNTTLTGKEWLWDNDNTCEDLLHVLCVAHTEVVPD